MKTENQTRPPLHAASAAAILFFALIAGIALVAVLDRGGEGEFVAVLQAETARIEAPVSGRIEADLAVGKPVKAGSVLFFIEDLGTASRTERLAAELAEAERKLAEAEARAALEIAWRREELDRARHQAELKLADLLRARFDLCLRSEATDDQSTVAEADRPTPVTLARQVLTGEDGSRGKLLSLAKDQNALEVIDAQIGLSDDRIAELEALSGALSNRVRDARGIDGLRKAVREGEDRLAKAESQSPRTPVLAERGGWIESIFFRTRDDVAAGQTLALLSDREERFLSVGVPANRLHEVVSGAEVTVRFPAAPHASYRGRIALIEPPASSPATAETAVALVRVEPQGKRWPDLPLGVPATVRLTSPSR